MVPPAGRDAEDHARGSPGHRTAGRRGRRAGRQPSGRGQVEMAEAVAHAFDTGEHLAVQAGTGTGKSLAYLVPAIARAVADRRRRWWCPRRPSRCSASSSTATCPALADALADALPRRPEFALLKGRGNYLCLNKIHNGSAAEAGRPPAGGAVRPRRRPPRSGRDVQRLTAWASTTETGDRDELTPGVPDRSWSQVSVSARECLGVARCPFGADCFAEKARAIGRARRRRRHQPRAAGHRRDRRGRGAARTRAARRRRGARAGRPGDLAWPPASCRRRRWAWRCGASRRLVEPGTDASGWRRRWRRSPRRSTTPTPGRIDYLDDELATYLTALRDAAEQRRARRSTRRPSDPKAAAARTEAIAGADRDRRHRRRGSWTRSCPAIPDRTDVVWLDHEEQRRAAATVRARQSLRVAPLSVAGLLRSQAVRAAHGGADLGDADRRRLLRRDGRGLGTGRRTTRTWRGLDVGSPFDHAKSGILYVAAHLPPPGRDGTGVRRAARRDRRRSSRPRAAARWDCSRRCARRRAAAEAMRERLDTPVLCQGDDTTVGAGRAVRRRPDDLAVRHAVAVAGRRRARARRCRWC